MIEFKKVEENEADIKILAQLASKIWHEYWNGKITNAQIDYMLDKFQSEHAIPKQIKNENYVYFYIIQDGQKAGYFALAPQNDYLFLSKIYIGKDYRYKGVGAQAFEFIKKFAKEKNHNKIRLTVYKYNSNSIAAYRKWGFEITDSIVTDIGCGFVMDDYVMEYNIKI